MAINVGEVNAGVRFQVATELLDEAKAKLVEMQAEFKAVGGSATEAGRAVHTAGIEQVQVVKELETQVKLAAEAYDHALVAAVNLANGQKAVAVSAREVTVATQQQADIVGGASLRYSVLAAEVRAAQLALNKITSEYVEVGGAGTYAGDRLVAGMTKAQISLDVLRSKLLETKLEMQNLGGADGTTLLMPITKLREEVDRTTPALERMEGMMERLMLRLAAYAAIRFGVQFVQDVIAGSEALMNFHRATDMTVEDVQRFQYVGVEYGLTIEQLARGIEQLAGRVAMREDSLKAAFKALGLSMDDFVAKKPKEIFLDFVEAAGRMGDKTEQIGVLAEALGSRSLAKVLLPALEQTTEGVSRFREELSKVPTVNIVDARTVEQAAQFEILLTRAKQEAESLALDTVSGLGDIAKAFEDVTPSVLGFGGALTGVQVMTLKNMMATAAWVGAGGSLAEAPAMFKALQVAAEAVPSVVEKVTETETALERVIRMNADAEEHLTDAQREQLDTLNELNILSAKNAKELGISTQQFAEYNKEQSEAAAAAKKLQEAWEEIKSAGEGFRGTLKGVATDTLATANALLDAGVSAKSIELAYDLTATQLRAIAMARAADAKALKEAATLEANTLEMTTKVQDKYNELVQQYGATTLQKQLAANEKSYQDALATAKKKGIVDEAYYNALEKLRKTSDALDQQHLSDSTKYSREHYQALYDAAAELYQAMLLNASDHTEKEIAIARHEMEEKRKILANWREQAVAEMQAFSAGGISAITDFVNGLGFLDAGLDETKIKVRMLSGEVITLAAAIARFSAGNSITYDLSTVAGVEHYRAMNTGATINLSDAQIIAMVAAGATLQSLIEAGYIVPYGNMAGQSGTTPTRSSSGGGGGSTSATRPTPPSPSLPAHAGTSTTTTTPSSGGIPAGGVITNHFYMNGTTEDVAHQISVVLMRQLGSTTLLGAS
jgi:hypothetical protein